MFITQTITKNQLEKIVHQTFNLFGNTYSSALLDSLKLLGFHYATNAGVSINIEDLKTPNVKTKYIKNALKDTQLVSRKWERGIISENERFQSIIDSWNVATESLKNKIVNYYQEFDPANNLYIMATSGARGNMSQVKQLIGMRGLMSDQDGNIIDLPIKANFREGLSSIDYVISSYGARKGIVDTALKTADSGYLTRRLIYLAQDLVIREIDCYSSKGIIFILNNSNQRKSLIGQVLISASSINSKEALPLNKNTIITQEVLDSILNNGGAILNLRTPTSCNSIGSICQHCYGWDLSKGNLVSLGEAVGVIAAQSIGEPGTQLTMRTFHTGGIFTSEAVQQNLAPFSGRIKMLGSLKTIPYRSNHGLLGLQLMQETCVSIINWRGIKRDIFLKIGSFIYIKNGEFVKKGQIISEYSPQNFTSSVRTLKQVNSPISGEIFIKNIRTKAICRLNKPKLSVCKDDSVLWIGSGKILSMPKEIYILNDKILDKVKALGYLKLVSLNAGLVILNNKELKIINKVYNNIFEFIDLEKNSENYETNTTLSINNYQYIDEYTVLSTVKFVPKLASTIFKIRRKNYKNLSTYLFITKEDTWETYSDNFDSFKQSKANIFIKTESLLNQTLKSKKAGLIIRQNGAHILFQKMIPIFVNKGTLVGYKNEDFIHKKEIIATLINYRQQTEDIVQGLPKIEEIIEARSPKEKAILVFSPGVFNINNNVETLLKSSFINDRISFCYSNKLKSKNVYPNTTFGENTKSFKKAEIIHSIMYAERGVVFNNKLYKALLLPPKFKALSLKSKNEIRFVNDKNLELILSTKGTKLSAGWVCNELPNKTLKLTNDKNFIKKFTLKKDSIFQNIKTGDFIIRVSNNTYIFLDLIEPILSYKIPITARALKKEGSFFDIGEPITEGSIDAHDLLYALYSYHKKLDGTILGVIRALHKFQLIITNSIQGIYQSQGVYIASKNIEIIVRQMTSKVVIQNSGDTPFFAGETLRLSLLIEVYKALSSIKNSISYKKPKFAPIFLSAINSSLNKDGFMSSAGFQETKKILSRAAIEGDVDWFRSLKESVAVGRLIPAGSAFLNYKNYLDNIYSFKN
jgi:hypothetical protein